jgi:hypothetical protein
MNRVVYVLNLRFQVTGQLVREQRNKESLQKGGLSCILFFSIDQSEGLGQNVNARGKLESRLQLENT